MRLCQSGADFLFQLGNRAQRHGGAKDILGQRLDVALAQTQIAGQIGQDGGQPFADAVLTNLGRDGRVVDSAAAGAGAGVALVLGDFHHDRRQFDALETRNFPIVGPRFGWQGRVTTRACRG